MPERGEGARAGETGAPFGVAEVHGPSMLPTLRHGDQLLVRYGARVRPGDVVVLRHPFQQDLLVVKRAVERRPGGWWVRGDNPYAGGDSTDYGTVPRELVLGRVLGRYRPRGSAEEDRPVAVGAGGGPAAGAGPSEGAPAGFGRSGGQEGPVQRPAESVAGTGVGGVLGSAVSLVRWGLSSVRPVRSGSSPGSPASRRLRAR